MPRGEPGWTRIGLYDSAERRTLWCLVGSGREGDDAYVKLTPADPQWDDWCGLLLRVVGDCGVSNG